MNQVWPKFFGFDAEIVAATNFGCCTYRLSFVSIFSNLGLEFDSWQELVAAVLSTNKTIPKTLTINNPTMKQRRSTTLLWQLLVCCIHSKLLHAVITSPDFSPSSFQYKHKFEQTTNNNDKSGEIDLGTTLVAIKFQGGVVVGADTRTSVGGYVSNKFAYKINPIFDTSSLDQELSSSSCVLCRSGSAADTQYLAKLTKRQFDFRKLQRPSYTPTVSEVAHFLKYQMRNSNVQNNFQASLICAGCDTNSGGRIFGITPGGSLWEEENFCVSGSGSTILLGYLDDALQNMQNDFSSNYTKEEAIALVTKLLKLSIGRDGSSGGLVRLYVIDQNGLQETTVYPSLNPIESSDSEESASSSSSNDSSFTDLEGFAPPQIE